MKRVTAFVASGRRRHTHHSVRRFLDCLQSGAEVESEIVRLGDCNVQTCRGCKTCFDRGEELCPLEDDRDSLIEKMMASDGVVFASPVYSFQVSALMKIFLDRLGFAFHRPRFFGKAFTSIVVEAIYGGAQTTKYLDLVGDGLGFNVVKGCRVKSLEPMTEQQQRENERVLAEHAKRFTAKLLRPSLPPPTLMHLMMFRMARTSIPRLLDDTCRDYTYYREKGWLEADYFYPVRLSPFKKAAGRFFDYTTARRLGR